MTSLVYAVPAAVEIPPPPRYWGLTVVWEGVDGSTWELSDWTSGVALLLDGFDGLHHPTFDANVLTADGVDGQFAVGVRALPRSVNMKIGVFAETADDWADLDARWWKSWHPLKTGTLTVSSKRGSRSIRLRLTPGSAHSYPRDPNTTSYAEYQLEATADQPLWAGDPVVQPWSSVDVVPFLDPAGSPPFHITPRNLVDSATLTNPGDVPVWPVWQVTAVGGGVTLTITCDGGAIGLPAMTAGQTIVVNTNPVYGGADRGTLIDGVLTSPVDIDPLLTPYQPRRVPDGATVPIGLSLSGPGRVIASLIPLYYRGLP